MKREREREEERNCNERRERVRKWDKESEMNKQMNSVSLDIKNNNWNVEWVVK